MKGRLLRAATLGVALAAIFASGRDTFGFHEDTHYSAIASIAIASGWPIQDAAWIANGDEAVDHSEDTVAGIEQNTIQKLPHLASKDRWFHCFSASDDTGAAAQSARNADVTKHLEELRSDARDAIDRATTAARDGAADQIAKHTAALISIGVFLHCQQDSWSHSGYGGTSTGHLEDDAKFESPDNPARRPLMTRRAMTESLDELSAFQVRWLANKTAPHDKTLDVLVAAMTHKDLQSKLEEGTLGRACYWETPFYWLFTELAATGRVGSLPDTQAAPKSVCRGAYGSAFHADPYFARRVVLEPPRYPRLNTIGKPDFDGAGNPVLLSAGTFDHQAEAVTASSRQAVACEYTMSLTVRNAGPAQAPAAGIVMALVAGRNAIWTGRGDIAPLASQQTVVVPRTASIPGTCATSAAYAAEIVAPANAEGWGDRNAANNMRVALVSTAASGRGVALR